MGGAYKPSRETQWRMDHPAPDPPRPTWRERRKARKKLKAKPGVRTYIIGFPEWGGAHEGIDLTLTFKKAKKLAKYMSKLQDEHVGVYLGWNLKADYHKGHKNVFI